MRDGTSEERRTPRHADAEENQLASLVEGIRALIRSARRAASHAVNTLQVLTNFEVGRRIVEEEQQGVARAEYGKLVIESLALELSNEFGRGFSRRNLEYMRRFYLLYKDRYSGAVKDRPQPAEGASGRTPGGSWRYAPR
ncbi:MAG: DUF1016 N-terminal domain-containing protein [Candidatus Hydrogenedentota bacterium]